MESKRRVWPDERAEADRKRRPSSSNDASAEVPGKKVDDPHHARRRNGAAQCDRRLVERVGAPKTKPRQTLRDAARRIEWNVEYRLTDPERRVVAAVDALMMPQSLDIERRCSVSDEALRDLVRHHGIDRGQSSTRCRHINAEGARCDESSNAERLSPDERPSRGKTRRWCEIAARRVGGVVTDREVALHDEDGTLRGA